MVRDVMRGLGPELSAKVNTGLKILGSAAGAAYIVGGLITRRPEAIGAGTVVMAISALHPKYSPQDFERIIYGQCVRP